MKKIIPLIALFAASCSPFSDKQSNVTDILKKDFPLLKWTRHSFEMSDQDKSGILITDKTDENNAAFLISDTSGKIAQFDENHITAVYIKTPDHRFKKGALYFCISKMDDTTYRAGVLHPRYARFPLKKDAEPPYVTDTIEGQVYQYKTIQPRIGILNIKSKYTSFSNATHDIALKSPAVLDAIDKVLKQDQPEFK